ncbi:MAG: exodeoxyribonuclease VII large subunit, partial [Planctomycetota bacterium]
ERSDGAAPPGDATVSVAELTDRIDRALKGFGRVAVMGEVSRPKKVASGHLFFTLKDDRAALDVKIWRSGVERALAGVGGRLEEGARVVCHGSLDVYAPYGKHSLVADRVEARGIGALLADLERLKTQLRSEGLFDRKRPLPARPRTVGVVTSRDADAWRDFMRTRTLRWPGYPVRLAHSRVQGRAAAAEIARAIRALDASGVDVVVVCRGGGAIEDLWCFNEEPVARAVFDCSVPVVTGVGHESDTTLVDFVADHRAHTPTDAAQTVIPERAQLAERLERAGAYLTESMERALERRAEALERLGRSRALVRPTELVDERELRLDGLARRAAAALDARGAALGTRLERASGDLSRLSPHARLSALDERLGALGGRLASSVARDLERTDERVGRVTRGLARGAREAREAAERRVDVLERALGAVSPLAVLDRGYSITRRADGGE